MRERLKRIKETTSYYIHYVAFVGSTGVICWMAFGGKF